MFPQSSSTQASANRNAESVAKHTILPILSVLRQLPQTQKNIRLGVLGAPLGHMVAGRTVCLYGLGATALSLARRLRAFDVKLLGITRDPEAPKVAFFGLDECYSTDQRNDCLHQTGILVLCLRLCDETRGLIDAEALGALPAGAYLINAARGSLVNYDELYAALSGGRLAGVGLDVYWDEPICFDDPLLRFANVVATPHVAGVTDRSYGEIADAVASNIERVRRGQPLVHRFI